MRSSSVTVLPLVSTKMPLDILGMSLTMSFLVGSFGTSWLALRRMAQRSPACAWDPTGRPYPEIQKSVVRRAVRTFSSCAPLESGQKKQMARPADFI